MTLRSIVRSLLVSVLIAGTVHAVALSQLQQDSLTGCDVMKRLKELDGKTVTLRGPVKIVNPGGDIHDLRPLYASELLPTTGESCKAPNTRLAAQIVIEYPEYHVLQNPPRGYKLDKDSVQRFGNAIKGIYLRNPSGRNYVNLVVQGILTVAKDLPWPPKRDAWYPAHLLLESYKSIEPQ
jgi:hypothetical protein